MAKNRIAIGNWQLARSKARPTPNARRLLSTARWGRWDTQETLSSGCYGVTTLKAKHLVVSSRSSVILRNLLSSITTTVGIHVPPEKLWFSTLHGHKVSKDQGFPILGSPNE